MRFILLIITIFFVEATIAQTTKQNLYTTKKVCNFLYANQPDSLEGYFSEELKGKFGGQTFKEVWTGLIEQMGTIGYIDDAVRDSAYKFDVFVVPIAFANANLDLKLSFEESGKLSGIFFAPAKSKKKYKAPSYANATNYTEENIDFGITDFKLNAKFLKPKTNEKFPCVIMVHGSGAHDADETIDDKKPFFDISQGLANYGIASFRYNKRTFSYPEKCKALEETLTPFEETVQDALEAIKKVKTLPYVDTNRIYILGHSLGGMLAPEIARLSTNLKGLIFLGANARPLPELYYNQLEFIFGLDSLDSTEKRKLQTIKKQTDLAMSQELKNTTPKGKLPMVIPAAYWIYLRDYKQVEVAKKLNLPFLILQGERDYQVTMRDFEIWQMALKDKATYKSYPKLFHLFIEGKGVPADYEEPGNVSQQVVEDIAKWVKP